MLVHPYAVRVLLRRTTVHYLSIFFIPSTPRAFSNLMLCSRLKTLEVTQQYPTEQFYS